MAIARQQSNKLQDEKTYW